MVSMKSIEEQLKQVGFNYHGWGRTEVHELRNILLSEEQIFECVNGFYDGGFALLVATDVRVLLIDKKPLNYLTVDDLRFDMINELDYNHRLFGAYISISAGNKNLKFTSLNQPRLRRLIGHVQRRMAEVKRQQSSHQETQNQHLEKINEQLQSYLLAQHEQQQRLAEQLERVRAHREPVSSLEPPKPIRPGPELADYLFARRLLEEHQSTTGELLNPLAETPPVPLLEAQSEEQAELYNEGRQEIFGKQAPDPQPVALPLITEDTPELNPLKVAYSKLPTVLRSRSAGGPVVHSASQEAVSEPAQA